MHFKSPSSSRPIALILTYLGKITYIFLNNEVKIKEYLKTRK